MLPVTVEAKRVAREEVSEGRNVMMLFPTGVWANEALKVKRDLDGVHMRFSNRHSGLKSLPIDTLILVAASDGDWDEEGLAYAKERLRSSKEPKTVRIER